MNMININLTPYEELEDRTWWIIEVAVMLLVGAAVHFFVEVSVADLRSEIEKFTQQQQEFQSNIDTIKAESKKLEGYIQENDKLKERIQALGDITVSEVTRFESVILVEFMHSLKPSGMWYKTMNIDSNSKKIDITGHVHDPAMVAHFIKSLISTADKKDSSDDIRSKFYFRDISIRNIRNSPFSLPSFTKTLEAHEFGLTFAYAVRS